MKIEVIVLENRVSKNTFSLCEKLFSHTNQVGNKCNAEVRWNEHNNPTKSSDISKHLRMNIAHCFTRTIISNASKMVRPGRIWVSYIVLWKPDLNKQKFFERQFYLKMVSHSAINERIQTS